MHASDIFSKILRTPLVIWLDKNRFVVAAIRSRFEFSKLVKLHIAAVHVCGMLNVWTHLQPIHRKLVYCNHNRQCDIFTFIHHSCLIFFFCLFNAFQSEITMNTQSIGYSNRLFVVLQIQNLCNNFYSSSFQTEKNFFLWYLLQLPFDWYSIKFFSHI